MVEVIQNMRRDANRKFVPVIADCMITAYEHCVAESNVQCLKSLQMPIEIGVGTGSRPTSSSTDGLVQGPTTSTHFGGNVKVSRYIKITVSKQKLVSLPPAQAVTPVLYRYCWVEKWRRDPR
ncbi:hypothetical protein W97_01931 [Coniosporium apollinis CBS 100218]|uniref:Uncharacterized protein n=1 Tax=Coniosporium apollinis (strain CBS 100218) TaxID=1168221 RepID=R7YLA6_CONA1|nr:uncharacterized protein W97_01931 [Coniosporium apollinis CBS 100218]EON62707.1 hypothetical protein W97_01931 [Coniosporium apollinis CBS 100218]